MIFSHQSCFLRVLKCQFSDVFYRMNLSSSCIRSSSHSHLGLRSSPVYVWSCSPSRLLNSCSNSRETRTQLSLCKIISTKKTTTLFLRNGDVNIWNVMNEKKGVHTCRVVLNQSSSSSSIPSSPTTGNTKNNIYSNTSIDQKAKGLNNTQIDENAPNGTNTVIGNYHTAHAQKKQIETVLEKKQDEKSGIGNFFTKAFRLMKHYQNGVKTIFQNSMKVKEIQSRLESDKAYVLSRQDHVLIFESKQDVRKSVPFILLAMFLPEAIPIVILKFPAFIPFTCWTEEQKQKRREKLVSERSVLVKQFLIGKSEDELVFATVDENVKDVSAKFPDTFDFSHWNQQDLKILAKFLGLSSWKKRSKLESDLIEHFEFIRQDDELLLKEIDSLKSLTQPDLIQACEMRGISSHGLGLEEQKNALTQWIHLSTWKNDINGLKLNHGLLMATFLIKMKLSLPKE